MLQEILTYSAITVSLFYVLKKIRKILIAKNTDCSSCSDSCDECPVHDLKREMEHKKAK